MIAIICISSIVASAAKDPCTRLCEFDGPSICTKGSFTKDGRVCDKYMYRGNPADKDYCYHTSETKRDCPSTGAPVKPEDVEGLIAMKSTTTVDPKTWTTEAFAEIDEFESTAAPISEEQALSDLIKAVFSGPCKGTNAETEILRRRLFDFVLGEAGNPTKSELVQDALAAIFIMSSDLKAQSGSSASFIDRELESFCSTHLKLVESMLVEHHERVWRERPWYPEIKRLAGLRQFSYLRDNDGNCSSIKVKQIALVHRVYAHFPLPNYLGISRVVVSELESLADVISRLMLASDYELSQGLEFYYGNGSSFGNTTKLAAWMERIAGQISDTYFMKSERGKMHIASPGEDMYSHYNYFAIGRFLALTLIQGTPVDLPFPRWFYTHLLGRDLTLADIEQDEPDMFAILNEMMEIETERELEEFRLERFPEVVARTGLFPTLANRQEIIKRMLETFPDHGVSLVKGFHVVIPLELFQNSFTGEELERLMWTGGLDQDRK
jgi:hypothetical protein